MADHRMMDTAEEFMGLTGVTSATEARVWLEAANFDFEVAVNMFFSSAGCVSIMSLCISCTLLKIFNVFSTFLPFLYGVTYNRGETVGGAIGGDVDIHDIEEAGFDRSSSSAQLSSMASTKSTDQHNESYPPVLPSTEDSIRAPDAAKITQLMQHSEPIHADAVTRNKRNTVSSVFAIGSGTFKAKTKKDITLEGLYGRPSELMFGGSFYELRQKGKKEDKWLLINIQAENVFNSHVLNRDVWADECIVDMVNCNFIFWQTQDFTEEGKVYAERYHVDKFPHIAILDPRTGGLVWSKEDIADKTYIAEHLQDFISDNPSPNTSRPGKVARGASLVEENDDLLLRPDFNMNRTTSNQSTSGSGSGSRSAAMNALFGSSVVQNVIAGEISSSELNKKSDNVLLNFLDESHQASSSSSSSSSSSVNKNNSEFVGFEVRPVNDKAVKDGCSRDKTVKLMLRFPDGNKSECLLRPGDFVVSLLNTVCTSLISDESNIGKRFDIWYMYPAKQLSIALKDHVKKKRKSSEGNGDKTIDETNITIEEMELSGSRCDIRFL